MKLKLALLFFLTVSCLFSQTDTTTIYNSDSCEWTISNVITYYCGSIYNWQDYELFVHSNCPVRTYYLTVYNRWGEIIYKSNDISKFWYAKEVEEGSYVYKINGTYEDGGIFDFTGTVYKLN